MLFTKNELTTQSGIYAIIDGKKQVIYIGSAEMFYNRWHRHRKDLRNNKHHGIKPPTHNEIPVVMLDKITDKPLQEFISMAEACRYCGKDHQWVSMIRDVLAGKRKTALGYKWRRGKVSNEY